MKHKALLMTPLSMALAVSMLLAGCGGSMLESQKIEYKSAGKLPPLEIPPDLTKPTRDDRYEVPDISPKGQATYSAYAGERAGQARTATAQEVLPAVENMRIERAGTQRWLVVPGSPEKIWPNLKEFWQDLGFVINIDTPETGVMETDWAENRAKIPQGTIRNLLGRALDTFYSTAERDKFRTRVEKGAQGNVTEIYISHRGMYEVYTNEGKTETRWQPRPADPELEAEMLRRLMVRLGADEDRAKAIIATPVPTEERARIAAGKDGVDVLELREAFDRGWRRVGLALDRVGFTVEDRDRSQGLYFVRYVDPEADASKKGESQGLLSRLAFWKSDKPDASKTPKRRILVRRMEEGSSAVQVLTAEGGVDTSDTGKKILRLLFEQLK